MNFILPTGHLYFFALPFFMADVSAIENGTAKEDSKVEDISAFITPFENRVDLDGDGTYDSYWTTASANSVCTLSLFDITSKRKLWSSDIKGCLSFPKPPIFYETSFMGDAKKDFSIVVKPVGDSGYTLFAGDGATGELRKFSFSIRY